MNHIITEKKTLSSGFQTIDLAYMGLFVALMAVCSWITIPMTIPITLQTFAIFAAVLILGFERGTISVIAYIILGAIGVPVFAGFRGGIGVLFGVTGGYLIGFIFAALITGGIIKVFGKKLWITVIAMVLGMISYYVFGTIWFMILYTKDGSAMNMMTALSLCVFPFIIPDCIKMLMALILEKSLRKYQHTL